MAQQQVAVESGKVVEHTELVPRVSAEYIACLLYTSKVIKKGIGEGSIRTCFCTGVLPVTMDDLTSGYNIAEILTLEPVSYTHLTVIMLMLSIVMKMVN